MTLRPAQGLHFPPCQVMALRATQDLVKIPKCEPGKQNCRAPHQCCRIKLGHHVVQENSQVSRAGFQELDVLEAAALPIDLQGYTGITSGLLRNERKDS